MEAHEKISPITLDELKEHASDLVDEIDNFMSDYTLEDLMFWETVTDEKMDPLFQTLLDIYNKCHSDLMERFEELRKAAKEKYVAQLKQAAELRQAEKLPQVKLKKLRSKNLN